MGIDLKAGYGLADFHAAHNGVTNFAYRLRFAANRVSGGVLRGISGALLSG